MLKPLELARQIEQWGLFRYCWSEEKKRITLHIFTPDQDFARRFSEHFQQRLYEYPGPTYAVMIPQRVTAITCYTLRPLFGCAAHKTLAALLMAATDAGIKARGRQRVTNTRGRTMDASSYKAAREDALKQAIDLLREKGIYNACPVRAAREPLDKQNKTA